MTPIDYLLLAVCAWALIHGLCRGVLRQVASVVGVLAGFILAAHGHLEVSHWLNSLGIRFAWLRLLVFAAILAGTWAAVLLLGELAARLCRALFLGWLDRVLGALLGLVKGIVICTVLVAIFSLFLPADSSLLSGSILVPSVQRCARLLVRLAPEYLQKDYPAAVRAAAADSGSRQNRRSGLDRPRRASP